MCFDYIFTRMIKKSTLWQQNPSICIQLLNVCVDFNQFFLQIFKAIKKCHLGTLKPRTMDTRQSQSQSQILCCSNSNSNSNPNWLMQNMDKGLTIPKWILKIPQMLQSLSAQIICLSPKVLDFKALLGVRSPCIKQFVFVK